MNKSIFYGIVGLVALSISSSFALTFQSGQTITKRNGTKIHRFIVQNDPPAAVEETSSSPITPQQNSPINNNVINNGNSGRSVSYHSGNNRHRRYIKRYPTSGFFMNRGMARNRNFNAGPREPDIYWMNRAPFIRHSPVVNTPPRFHNPPTPLFLLQN